MLEKTLTSADLPVDNPMQAYQAQFENIMAASAFSLGKAEKAKKLNNLLNTLYKHHFESSDAFRKIAYSLGFKADRHCTNLDEHIYVAVRLFKLFELSSIQKEDTFKVLSSSGTTSQTPARIILDKQTSARQSKVLVNIMQSVIGKQRLPMLVIDSEAVARGKGGFSARTAGIQGLSFFGRKHVYALNDDMSPNWQRISEFFEVNQGTPVLLFGFTFMIWQYLVCEAKSAAYQFQSKDAVIIHSGGWKKLESQKVDNLSFKKACDEVIKGSKVHNFYGMAEQVGSVFIECEYGHLHAPNMADIIVRNPDDLSVCKHGEKGLIQVISTLPTSYPGYSILTEDLGRIHGEDDCLCGRKGKYFEVLGRLPKAEVRGCSDTHA
ncbi:acyl-protein synthetase [Glaciecola sp. KUL10]|uniref:LuxE/PaaK family acyltransferase n=1 Tax=Glaciecola sp. (strain KUL10) TaxID=2161813 RepID=UPI000D96AB4F|nr:acyl-protein synthetase [Glaciecola sp. KUL10]GBL04614.1 hypothetical protein KUL10_19210 [Glaciecola sp. KUL10]